MTFKRISLFFFFFTRYLPGRIKWRTLFYFVYSPILRNNTTIIAYHNTPVSPDLDLSLMLLGIRFRANPTEQQKRILSQWMGCARLIWNAKCDEERYYATFARKYHKIGTYAPIDQKASQFKNKELTPWLYTCPSQIIRNAAVNWYQTFQKFIKKQCGKPKRKPKTDKGSIHLTRELFKFEENEKGNLCLFIGTKTNNIGYLSFKPHRSFRLPKSIYIKKERGQYTVSFCYEEGGVNDQSLLNAKCSNIRKDFCHKAAMKVAA